MKSPSRMRVPYERRNLVPDTWAADGEGALPKLGPCPHDNSCVGCRGTEMATSRFFSVEFDDVAEICRPELMKNGMHSGLAVATPADIVVAESRTMSDFTF